VRTLLPKKSYKYVYIYALNTLETIEYRIEFREEKLNPSFKDRRSGRNKPTPWYEDKYKGPLSIALIGALIAAVTQLTATVLPIYFGPSNLCDFSITSNPATADIMLSNISGNTVKSTINVWDIHQRVKPYQHQVNIKVVSPIPKGITIVLEKTRQGYLPLKTEMTIKIDGNCTPGDYEIIIQGAGADSTKRNCTYLLSVQNLQENNLIRFDKTIYRVYSSTGTSAIEIAKKLNLSKN
jgi:hypothetical protein